MIIPTIILLQINCGILKEQVSLKTLSFLLLGSIFTLDLFWLYVDFKRMDDDRIDELMYGGKGMIILVIFLNLVSMLNKVTYWLS